ncbi:MAG: TOBE domain-containing protein [Pseudomonadota bacterium]
MRGRARASSPTSWGVSNFLRARVVGSDADGLRLTAGRLEITAPRAAEAVIGEEVEIAIRPEQIALHAAAPAPMVNAAAGRIAAAIYQGVTSSYEIRLDGPDAPSLIVRESNRLDGIGAGPRLAVGAQVWATWRPEAAQVLRA